ncbi:hypothetical protein BGX23_001249 [Mortierella sp. AD031]|nr:hypothetical protein BGX23_001249 [Mortierella sp. AD031]
MAPLDIDHRSVSFADSNVQRNHLDDAIKITKNNSTDIFPEFLFNDPEKRYDFCMCNPPFYKDEQDIQDGLETKEDRPSAVCKGTTNEMMTAGGETQFVKQMVDESILHGQRIRWYTSMLGKRSSVDKIIAYLKEKKASIQNISNKMIKLTPPKTILSFQCEGPTTDSVQQSAEGLLDRLLIQHSRGAIGSEATESAHTRVLHCTAKRNTWSRAARRALARESANKGDDHSGSKTVKELSENVLVPVVLEFDIRVSSPPITIEATAAPTQPSHTIEFVWVFGGDRDVFESCFLHFRSRFQKDHVSGMQEQLNKKQAP